MYVRECDGAPPASLYLTYRKMSGFLLHPQRLNANVMPGRLKLVSLSQTLRVSPPNSDVRTRHHYYEVVFLKLVYSRLEHDADACAHRCLGGDPQGLRKRHKSDLALPQPT